MRLRLVRPGSENVIHAFLEFPLKASLRSTRTNRFVGLSSLTVYLGWAVFITDSIQHAGRSSPIYVSSIIEGAEAGEPWKEPWHLVPNMRQPESVPQFKSSERF